MQTYRIMTRPVDETGAFTLPPKCELVEIMGVAGNANKTVTVVVRIT